MMQKYWNKKNKKDFTLVELMVVVAIIAILIAIAIPIYNTITENAQKTACQANQRTIDSAVMQLFASTGKWPAEGAAGTTELVTAKFIKDKDKACPTDATKTYEIDKDTHEASCKVAGHERTTAAT